MGLENLARLRDSIRRRESTYDRTGGNADFVKVPAGGCHQVPLLAGPGVIRHIWMTLLGKDPHLLRTVSLRIFWDGAKQASVDVPVGDFFGIGFGDSVNLSSLPLQRMPQNGKGMNCFFPMPFANGARIEILNESALPLDHLFYYIDWEQRAAAAPEEGYFHAWFNRENPTDGIDETGVSNHEFQMDGENKDGEGNYLVLDVTGRGHYVGAVVSIHNLRQIELSNWYGEGDDMFFIDGDRLPTLHGTGTEDYFTTAWGPNQAFCGPYSGLPLPGGVNFGGRSSMYRFHIEDPVMFRKSLLFSIEHGHANRRSDDWSSVAYWYAAEPGVPNMGRIEVEDRIPYPADHLPGMECKEASDCG